MASVTRPKPRKTALWPWAWAAGEPDAAETVMAGVA